MSFLNFYTDIHDAYILCVVFCLPPKQGFSFLGAPSIAFDAISLHFIPVSYEAVCEQPQQELDRLQQELGLTPEPVVTARFLEISMPSIAEPGDHEHYAPIAAEAQPGPGSEALH